MLRKCTVTTIGNNVFIGMNSIILPGAIVGDNVVVGAGSVVSGKYPSNVVIAGNPAQVICSLDEYYEKNFQRFEEYAKIYYRQKSKFLGRKLTDREMGWYTALYKCADKEEIISNMRVDGDEKEEVIQDVMKIEPKYNSLEELLGELY